MSIFDDIKTGLEQAIEYEKGNLKAKTTTLTVEPIESFKPEDIRSIRKETGLTQILFAKFMGVSVKTVEFIETLFQIQIKQCFKVGNFSRIFCNLVAVPLNLRHSRYLC